MSLSYSDEQIQTKAVDLGLTAEGEPLPRHLRGKVVAALAAEQQRPAARADVPVAKSIVVQPGGDIEIDGKPFPWIVQAEQMTVTLAPDGSGTVRLTIPAGSIQIIKPEPESENRA